MLHPELFGNVLSQSGSFQSGNGRDVKSEFLASQYRARAKLALRFFVEAGSLEDNSKQGLSLLAANRRFVEILKSKGYPVTYEEVDGTHDPAVWRDTLVLALMTLMK
jgi:enterochelin esterase-like enzyme